MAYNSQNANIVCLIDGNNVFPPKNWQDIGVKASFIEGDVQPAITVEEFEFILDAYQILLDWIASGNIFEGVPFQLIATSTLGNENIFEGYIDLRGAIIDAENGAISAKVRYKDDISSISERLQALDFGYLYQIGVFTDSDFTDIDYSVVKIDYTIEAFIQSMMLYTMIVQLYELVQLIEDNIATIAGIFAAGITGSVGAAIYAIGSALANIVYATLLVIQIIKLGTDLILAFVQPRRTHKSMQYLLMLQKLFEYLGYEFNTSVSELSKYYYLPSNTNIDEYDGLRGFLSIPKSIENGLPNILDFGYICSDFVSMIKDMFNGKFAVLNGRVEFHSELSNFWELNSTYTLPNILAPAFTYNTDELNSSVFVAFSVDNFDGYTIQNFRGTNYQVITKKAGAFDPKSVIIENLKEVRFPVALGNRKDSLNGFEKTLKFLASIIDGLVNSINTLFFLGGNNSNLAGLVSDKIGILKVEKNNHTLPKAIYLDGTGKLPANHRDLLSAKYLWNNYINELSFIQNSYKRQRKIYENIQIPFGLSDYQKLIQNNSFITESGEIGRIFELEWTVATDTAVISYYIESIYTTSLIESYIEPS